jgi:thiol-disulfide isomerase/thioredoxin
MDYFTLRSLLGSSLICTYDDNHLTEASASRLMPSLVVVLFYRSDCPFSIEFMPHFLALMTHLPSIFFARIDVSVEMTRQFVSMVLVLSA